MPEIAVVPAKAAHIRPIGMAMSEWDAREAQAFGQSPRLALRLGLIGSTDVWTALVDGEPAMMWGVCPVSLWEGRVWGLGTDRARACKRDLLAIGKAAIDTMLARYGRLTNHVAAGNVKARLALRYWGAVEGSPVEIGGADFIPFVITASVDSPDRGRPLGVLRTSGAADDRYHDHDGIRALLSERRDDGVPVQL